MFIGQLYFNYPLHPVGSQLNRDANKEIVYPMLPLKIGGRERYLLLIRKDGFGHLYRGGDRGIPLKRRLYAQIGLPYMIVFH